MKGEGKKSSLKVVTVVVKKRFISKRNMIRKKNAWRRRRPEEFLTIEKTAKVPEYNFLKYIRIVRRWACKKYQINLETLEMLLFLYDELYFTEEKFKEIDILMKWDRNRVAKMVEDNLFVITSPDKTAKAKKIYALSMKAKNICAGVYKMLTQEKSMPETRSNPLFTGKGYTDKRYRKAISFMNETRNRGIHEGSKKEKESSIFDPIKK